MNAPPVVQAGEDYWRKGAILAVRTNDDRFFLDRVIRSKADRRVLRRITHTEKLGDLSRSPMRNTYTITRAVRARDLWAAHEQSVWPSLEEARQTVEEFLA